MASPAPTGNGKKFKVCVCGGAGGIGQPLSLLMAMDERVGELSIYDLTISAVPSHGVAADLSHLERGSRVRAYSLDPKSGQKPVDVMEECLRDCDLVLIPAGVPRKPGMNRSDLLQVNIGIAKDLIEATAKFCPKAIVGGIVNPVNSVVPAMCEVYKQKGLDPMKIIGVTTLDVVRANKFVHEATGTAIEEVQVPVVGGHAGKTILPLFSQDPAGAKVAADKVAALDKRVQEAGTEVVEAKAGKGSATLSMAFAGARFGKSVLAGLDGARRTECAYVMSGVTDLPFFTSKVTFGPGGVEEVHPLGELSAHEQKRLDECKALLKGEIEDGLKALGELAAKSKL